MPLTPDGEPKRRALRSWMWRHLYAREGLAELVARGQLLEMKFSRWGNFRYRILPSPLPQYFLWACREAKRNPH